MKRLFFAVRSKFHAKRFGIAPALRVGGFVKYPMVGLFLLFVLLLGGCAGPVEDNAQEPAIVDPVEIPLTPPEGELAFSGFTAENYPRVDGSTATIPLIAAVESALLQKPRVEIAVPVSKTSGAYYALANNEADILLVYDGGDELRREINADKRFETVAIGKDALVFVVSSANPVDNLTTAQVRQIFSGAYTNWSQVGGNDEPIRAYQRGLGSGSQALMDKLVMQELPLADPALVQVIGSMGGLMDAVANYAGGPTGIGYNVYFYVTEMRNNDGIKILSIDGVEPTYETIQSGAYPFVSEFYSVIRESEPENSPARALHQWMLTDEAQNLLVSENYVALHANPAAPTPYVDGEFSIYPAGEEPVYLEGVNRYALEPAADYGQLYFYLGSSLYDDYIEVLFYGLCDAAGRIVTEPVYTEPALLTDSRGNKAYLCYRSDLEQGIETVTKDGWTYEKTVNPMLFFATDGSWVMELGHAQPFIEFEGPSDAPLNADVLAVKRDGKWGAVNMKGEVAIPFNHDSFEEIYVQREFPYYSVTGNRFICMEDNGTGYSFGMFSLYDSDLNLLATGLHGWPSAMAGEYIVTEDGESIYTYTLDGEPIAQLEITDEGYYGTYLLGDYVAVYSEKNTIICDRELNVLYELAHPSYELTRPYDEEKRLYNSYRGGPGVLYQSSEGHFHRTYLPDGTRLVTWYDPL